MKQQKICVGEILIVQAQSLQNVTYSWKGPNSIVSNSSTLSFPVTNVSANGKYTLTATYGNNCTEKDSMVLTVNDIPQINTDTFYLATNGTLKENVLINDFLNNTTYTISIKNNIKNGTLELNNDGSFTYKPTKAYKGTDNFTYEVCYDNCPNACSRANVILKISDNYKPVPFKASEVITPNGDGMNDELVIENFDATDPDNTSSIIVYNQWGGIVHQATPYLNDWSGTYKDLPLPEGTYYYIFKKDETSEPLKSFVTILR